MSVDIDGKGWMLANVTTREELERAENYLIGAVNKIRTQLESQAEEPTRLPSWGRTARHALRIKEEALIVIRRRLSETSSLNQAA